MKFFSKNNPFERLYRISLRSAFIISLPILSFLLWLIADTFIDFHRINRQVFTGDNPKITIDLFHKIIRNDFINAGEKFQGENISFSTKLPVLQMQIDAEDLQELNSDLPKSGKARYHKAYVKYKNSSYTVKVRYRGGGHWHWLAQQKSWRIKTSKKKLIEGLRKFNIVNPKTILSFEEALSMQIANQNGLMAPICFPIRFVLNNRDMGVYYFWEQVDESLVRRYKKMPGSVYDGDGGEKLWKEQSRWEKVASRNAEMKSDRSDIESLISAIENSSLKDFYNYALKHIDVDNYLLYLSLDSLAGIAHHTYVHNHKLYFDPLVSKFYSIPWDNHLWHSFSEVGLDYGQPLLNKLKQIPVLDLKRHKTLWDLLNVKLSEEYVMNLFESYYQLIRPEINTDPYRDTMDYSYRSIFKFNNVGLTQFSMKKFDKEYKNYKDFIPKRYDELIKYLSHDQVEYWIEKRDDTAVVRVLGSGNVASKISAFNLTGNGNKAKLYRDVNFNKKLDKNDLLIGECNSYGNSCTIEVEELIYPGYKWVKHINPRPAIGTRYLEPTPINYQFLVSGDFLLKKLTLVAQNAVTGSPSLTKHISSKKPFSNNNVSLHPWDLPPKPQIEQKVLGPGRVAVNEDLIFEENIELTILPGTTFRLAEGVSIFCYGKVLAEGTFEQPIIFEAADPEKPWGAFVLQGNGSDNSTFEWCSWQDGSIASRNLINYSGMVSMHDVDNLLITNCYLGPNHIGDDGLHLAYCENFRLENSLFEDARSDAVDIDISKGTVTSNRFVKSGNDSLDFMTSEAAVDRCYFRNSGDKGISVGEKSKIEVDRSVFEYCNIGMEIKDQSIVNFKNNVIRNSPTAINLYKKNWRYNGGGKLIADTVFAINCSKGVTLDKKSEVVYNRVETKDSLLPVWDNTAKLAGRWQPSKANIK